MIRIENIKTYDGPGVYIGRAMYLGKSKILGRKASILANPHKITKYVDREECIERYREYFEEMMEKGGTFGAFVAGLAQQAIKAQLILLCWCTPLNCHGSVIRDYIQYHTETLNGRWYTR